ncbi:MAG: hypothetical protein ACI83P_001647 [Janthinobacterium sp.]|jgi:hypothetical protein
MADKLTKIFDYFSDADSARKALLASGFTAPHIHLMVKLNEAGMPEGRFAAGDTPNQAIQGVFQLLGGEPPASENRQRHQSSSEGMYQLGVEVEDAQQSEHASVILARFGGNSVALP